MHACIKAVFSRSNWKILHSAKSFYTTSGCDGCDKYEVCSLLAFQPGKFVVNRILCNQGHNGLGVTTAHEPSRGRCPAVCNARDCNTVKVNILGDVLCSTVLFNKFWIECLHSLNHQPNFTPNIPYIKVNHLEPPFQRIKWCQINTKYWLQYLTMAAILGVAKMA